MGEPILSYKLDANRRRDKRPRLIGHPYIPIGMGEHLRATWRALAEVGLDPVIVDVFGPSAAPDPALEGRYGPAIVPELGDGANIFCLNGDEIEPAVRALQHRNIEAPGSTNIVYPAWELERYPKAWAEQLDLFDRVWVSSRFTEQAMAKAVTIPVSYVPLSCEVKARELLSRRHFGIRDSAYAFLFAFDFLSYVERKNPFAVIAAFTRIVEDRPFDDIQLVIKTNHSDRKPEMKGKLDEAIAPLRDRVVLIDRTLRDAEMKGLVWLADCFVSLHRSEGFGFGIAEAMVLGKPVIVTAYSGNMDYCTEDTARLIPYVMRPVLRGEYPRWEGQSWADADVDAAADAMAGFVADPESGRSMGQRARLHMAQNFSSLAVGRKFLDILVTSNS